MHIQCKDIHFSYGDTPIIQQLNLEVNSGELITILGPSGCGKTTLLRLLAGLIPLQEGKLLFDTLDVSNMTPQKRDVAMVFQSYALFPHMTVLENVLYGIKSTVKSRSKQLEIGLNMLETVGLSGFENRSVQSLSGGQQQRVALARAMVLKPSVLLFDEPLSNLDQHLRVQMRREIRFLQQSSGITTIYVTHDQEEAMAISDRIVVMNEGEVLQIGTPEEIYTQPNSPFVASFMGIANILDSPNAVEVFRPEHILIDPKGRYEGKVLWQEYLGRITRLGLLWHDKEIICEQLSKSNTSISIHQNIRFNFDENIISHVKYIS